MNSSNKDPFDLARFLNAQADTYDDVLSELRMGHKKTHWIWFIFPQFAGLGTSDNSVFYSIKTIDEAKAYVCHPILGPRLNKCASLLLQVAGRSAKEILGHPDDLKLRSSMSLFAYLDGSDSVFQRVLAKYFEGRPDPETLRLLTPEGAPNDDSETP